MTGNGAIRRLHLTRGECEVQAIHPTGEINPNECHYCLDCQVTYWNDRKCPPMVARRKHHEGVQIANFKPVVIEDGDECALCGMTINNFPGSKGQVYVQGHPQPLKFCSTRDMFAYLTQPEAQTMAQQAYVHDMAATRWEDPAFSAFVEARSAWYVIDHPLRGAMGSTLASFKEHGAAEAFAAQYDGRVLAFEEITADLVSHLG